MRERLRNFERVYEFFLFTQKRIERFNESRFKSRKVKGRATSSENRKFFVAVMEGTLGVVKKMLTNSGFVKLLWAYVVFARAGKTLAVGRGTRIAAKVFPALAKTTYAHNNFTNPLLVNIFLTTPNVPSITATKNFLFSLEVALPFTFLLLKRLSLNLSILFCVNKKNSYTLSKFLNLSLIG